MRKTNKIKFHRTERRRFQCFYILYLIGAIHNKLGKIYEKSFVYNVRDYDC